MILFDKVPLPEYVTNLWNFNVEYEEENPNYRCAMGKIHVVNASKIFILLEFAFILLYMYFAFPWWIMWIAFHLLLIIVTIYAVKQEKARWMWPSVLATVGGVHSQEQNKMKVVSFFSFATLAAFLFVIGIFSTQTFLKIFQQGHHSDFISRLVIVILVKAILLCTAGLLFWRFAVFHTTRKYFEAKQDGDIEMSDPGDKKGLDKLLSPL